MGGTGNGDGSGKGEGTGRHKKQENIQIIPMVIVESVPSEQKIGPSIKKKPIKKRKFKSTVKCTYNSWFGGIGIQEDETRKVIEEVYPGYPAYNAGLKAMDVIMSTDAAIRGEPGTVLSIIIFRPSSNETLTFNIVRDRISYGSRK